ncbi:MAG: imidazolonepropionase [Anaerolineae bacterium]|nr:imidazolonepropionase [Anaerolineae bacterium]
MLIHSASQLLTLAGPPQRGDELGRLGIISDGAVLVKDGVVAEVGTSAELKVRHPDAPWLDAGGKVVMPGLVDSHTHLVWAGDRAREFEMRIQGKTYLEIMTAGGGINATVQATRQASRETLLAQTRARADILLSNGTTTVEAKTGYGLETATELRQLETLLALDQEGPLEIIPTFMGAHAIPPEYQGDADRFTQLICQEMLPVVKQWWADHSAGRPLPFVDVFCEAGAFNLEQSRCILETARQMGFPLKIHADEFEALGGARLAAELGAVSAEHLVKTPPEDIKALAQSQTVAVALPPTPFGLGDPNYTPAKAFLEAGGLLAIASDLNPGPAWCESMQFVIALACRYLRLTPAQAIAAATINAAAAVNRAAQIGSIEPGKQADLLLLDTEDYRHLGYRFGGNLVKTVIKRGQVVLSHPG